MVRIWVGLRIRSGWPAKNMGRVTGQPIFASGQKMGFGLGLFQVGWAGLENSNSFYHV